MTMVNDGTFFFGDWQVEPSSNSVRQGTHVKQLEPKAMDVLLLLCQRANDVVSSDDIVSHCWAGIDMGDNPLHKVINQLRRTLGDSATAPTYIETIRKRGYRTLAEVRFPIGQQASAQHQSWHNGSPFPGLQAYSAQYADVFFGRGEQITTLLKRIGQQIKYGRSFCLILGPSGSGKSSLIHAGVMPNLMTEKGYDGIGVVAFSHIDLADVTTGQLLSEFASAMLDWEVADTPVFDGHSADTLASLLVDDMPSVIAHCQHALAQSHYATARFALFIDRLEVLLSSPLFTDAEREHFIGLLEQLATTNAVLLISACRNDFYPRLVAYPSLMAGKARGAHFDLAPPSRNELLQMIRLPAVAADLSWEIDSDTAMPLDEILCRDAASNPDALPMLQYTLQALYLQRSDNQLQFSVYAALGGIEGAIGRNAEQAIVHLSEAEKASLSRILSLLVTLREDEKSITSRTARWSQLHTEAENTLVQAMVDSRLFVSHLQHGEPCFSIAHEALLRRWPRATAWIKEHNDSLSIKSRLQHLSQRWIKEGKHTSYLLVDGKPLKEAQNLQKNPLFSLDTQEAAFIAASTKRASMLRWTRRVTLALLCVLTLTSIIMSVRSIEAEKLAQQKRLAAEDLLGFMVGDFADKMRGIGRMDLLDGISNKALDYFTHFSSVSDDKQLSFDARFQHGQTLEAMGEVAYSRNKIDEAHAALLAAQHKMLPLLELQTDNLALLKTLGANAFWLGQLKYDVSDWAAARPFFEQYLAYSQRMYALAAEDKDALMELSYAHNTLGSLAMKGQEFAKAQQNFDESLRLKQLALAKTPDDSQLIADVANARSWLASATVSLGDLTSAISINLLLQSELEAQRKSNNSDGYLLERLSVGYLRLSLAYEYQGQLNIAFSYALQGEQAIQQAVNLDPANVSWKVKLYYLKLQLMLLNASINDQQVSHTPESLGSELANESENFIKSQRYQPLKATYLKNSAYYYTKMGQAEKASSLLNEAINLFSDVVHHAPTDYKYYASLSEVELLTAKQAQSKNDLALMHSRCINVKNRLAPIQAKDKDPQYLYPYAIALACLGELDKHTDLIKQLKKADIQTINF